MQHVKGGIGGIGDAAKINAFAMRQALNNSCVKFIDDKVHCLIHDINEGVMKKRGIETKIKQV